MLLEILQVVNPERKFGPASWRKRSSAKGTPRRYIYGTGKTGGGSHQIKIHTVNGNIYLRRGQ